MEWIIFLTMVTYHGLRVVLAWVVQRAEQDRERHAALRRYAFDALANRHGFDGRLAGETSLNDFTRDELDRLGHQLSQLRRKRQEKPEKVDWKNEGF